MEWIKEYSETQRIKIVQVAKNSLKKEEGKIALNDLRENRKISDKIIDDFDFGYCPTDYDTQLGGRIITPFYDTYGDLLVITTRHLDRTLKGVDRFWHETFDKGSYLYGLHYAKQNILKYKKAIVVEGEMDVAVLHSNDFSITVGVCGSAFTLSQASLLARYCSEVYFLFDGDDPGKLAAERVLKLYNDNGFDAYGIKYIPVYLPPETDPDEFVITNGRDALKDLMIRAKQNNNIWN